MDANTGAISLSINQTDHALNRSVCDAGRTATPRSRAYRRYVPKAARRWGSPTQTSAYQYSGDTYDFYKENFGRDSLDRAGAAWSTGSGLRAEKRCPYQNAYWNGEQMRFGEGFAAADDVVGARTRPRGHGVDSDLFY